MDKLRILWIDDCEGNDLNYGFPEPSLPPAFSEYFVIVKAPEIPGNSTVRNPADFASLLGRFWNKNDRSIFPVEIVAMDYVLTKYAPAIAHSQGEIAKQRSLALRALELGRNAKPATASTVSQQLQTDTFEGLVLGSFYAALVRDHPIGLVPMTNYPDQMLNVPEVRALHELTHRLLEIDYSRFHTSGGDRAWSNVIPRGVAAFRERLEQLAKKDDVHISLQDLLELAEHENYEVLTVTSRYGRRRYPVKALFMDGSITAKDWSKQLLLREIDRLLCEKADPSFQTTLEDLKKGRDIAEELWKVYCSNRVDQRLLLSKLLARRKYAVSRQQPLTTEQEKRLSNLSYQRQTLTTAEKAEFDELCNRQMQQVDGIEPLSELEQHNLLGLCQEFGMATADAAACTECSGDLEAQSGSDTAKRWAVLMIMVRLLHACFRAQVVGRRRNLEPCAAWETPIEQKDIFLALFSIPRTPPVLPWHSRTQDPSARWKKSVNDILGADVMEILRGEHLTDVERHILRMYAESVEDEAEVSALRKSEDLHDQAVRVGWSDDSWRKDRAARRLLYGAS